jgi:hypothetical protein
MAEVALLLQLAGGRLAIGDCGKALQYVHLAQQICPAKTMEAMPAAKKFIDCVTLMADLVPREERGAQREEKWTPLRNCGLFDRSIWQPPDISTPWEFSSELSPASSLQRALF